MAKRIVCLTCLSAFGPDDITWADHRGVPADPPPPPRRRGGGGGVFRSGRFRGAGRRNPELGMADLADWVAKGHQPKCPLGHTLPLEVAERDSVVVGLIGEPGASKSHYLAALVVGLIEKGLLTKAGSDIGLAPDCRQQFAMSYQIPLFGRHSVLPATQLVTDDEERSPIVLVLRNVASGQETNIIIYDPSGEQLNSSMSMARYNPFLYAADALFIFVPPAVLPGLAGRVQTPDDDRQTLLQTKGMVDELEVQLRRVGREPKTDVVVAVLLAKADLCRGLDGFDDALLTEPDYDQETLEQTLARIMAESDRVSQFMTHAQADNLVMGLAARFKNLTFHAVSATGCTREQDTYPVLRPTRCADPLLWVLAGRGKLAATHLPAVHGPWAPK